MATTAGCAAAVLAAVLAFNHVDGADQRPTPMHPPVAPSPPEVRHWLDLPWKAVTRGTLGSAAEQLSTATGHPILCPRLEWFLAGRDRFTAIELDTQSPRLALDRLTTRLGASWMLVEEQVLIDDPSLFAILRSPQIPSAAPDAAGQMADLQQGTHLNILIDPGVRLKPFTWEKPIPAVAAFGLIARSANAVAVWRDESMYIHPEKPPRLLDDPDRGHLVIRGRPWTPELANPLDRPVDIDVQDRDVKLVIADLATRTGVAIDWSPADGINVTLRVAQMPALHALQFIAKLSNTTLAEPEPGKRVTFVNGKP